MRKENNHNHRYINYQLYLIIFFFLSIYKFSRSIQKGWINTLPNTTEIIPPVQYLRGFINNDLLGESLAKGIASRTSYFLDLFLPIDDVELFASFINLDKILFAFTLTLIIFVISNFVTYLIKFQSKSDMEKYVLNNNYIIVITAIVVSLSIKSFKVFNYYSLIPIASFGWQYPPNFGLNPSGLALIFILISILIPLIVSSRFKNIKLIFENIILLVSILCFGIGTYIHPQLPLGVFTVLIPIRLLFLSKEKRNYLDKCILFYSITWFTNAIIVLKKYSGSIDISKNQFFDIYIGRLSGHYLPSYYLNEQKTLLILLINISLITICYLLLRLLKLDKKNNFIKLNLTAFCLALTFTIIQYFGVEILKIPFLMKIGVSRFTYSYGFFYISSIVYFLAKIITKIKLNRIIGKYFQEYFRKINKINFLNLIIIILIVNFYFLNTKFLNLSKKNIANSPSMQLAQKINTLKYKNRLIIFLDDTDKIFYLPRVIGKLTFYHDRVFPFDTDAMLEWNKRKNKLEKLNLCLKINSNDCFRSFDDVNIIFISKSQYNKLNSISDFIFDQKKYYLSTIKNEF